jgi:Domain of unknown function (DUF4157)
MSNVMAEVKTQASEESLKLSQSTSALTIEETSIDMQQRLMGAQKTVDGFTDKVHLGRTGEKSMIDARPAHQFANISLYQKAPPAIQPKLAINIPGDEYEQEADSVADEIMRMPDKNLDISKLSPVKIQRKCATCGKEEELEEGNDAGTDPIETIQRKCAACEEEEEKYLQRKQSGNTSPAASGNVQQILQSTGQPLDQSTRSFMENRFGFDFSKVQIHNNSLAHQSAKDINALAYTHQHHIAFGAGQYQPHTESGKKLLAHELTHTLQQDGNNVRRMVKLNSAPISQAGFIVEDDVSPAEGVMTKSAFMATLNDEVCIAVNEGLQGTSYSSDNCPYIRALFARQASSSAAQIEQLIMQYEPSTTAASSAEDMIRLLLVRVRSAVRQWKQRESLEDVSGDIAGMMAAISLGPRGAGVTSADEDTTVQFKANPGGANNTQSPQSVMQSLGKGHALDSNTRSKMEGAFETSFSNVEIHTDSHAANIATGMNARAFAVGNHIAFAGGEHKPGTLIGDALIAHELAHVVQQNGTSGASYSSNSLLEEDADTTAVGVMAKVITGKEIDSSIKKKSSIRSGLRLSRCDYLFGEKEPEQKELPVEKTPEKPPPPEPDPQELYKPVVEAVIADDTISEADWTKLRAKADEIGIDESDIRRVFSDADFVFESGDIIAKIIKGKGGVYLKLIKTYAPKVAKDSGNRIIDPTPVDALVKIVIEDNQIDKDEFTILRDFSFFYNEDIMKASFVKAQFLDAFAKQLSILINFGMADNRSLLALPTLFPVPLVKDTKTGSISTSVDLNNIIFKTLVSDNEIRSPEFEKVRSLINGFDKAQATQFFIDNGIEATSADLLVREFLLADFKRYLKKRPDLIYKFKTEAGLLKLTDETVANINQPFLANEVKKIEPIAGREYDSKGSIEDIGVYTFSSGLAEKASREDYSFGGHQFDLIIAESIVVNDDSIYDRIDYALSVIPAKFFVYLKTLKVDPGNREDVAADASTEGIVNLYLSGAGSNISQERLALTMVHEFGHLISYEQAKKDPDFWSKWEKAIETDGLSVSRYSFTNEHEDFAETFVIYYSGGKDDSAIRLKYAKRFAILDKIFSGK